MNDLDSCKGCRYYGLYDLGSLWPSEQGYDHHCYRNSGGGTRRSTQHSATSDEPPSAPPACKDKEAKL